MADPRHLLGSRAEDAAAVWLLGHDWQILGRRWQCAGGELDLVCRDPSGALVGVEVKVRRSARAGGGAESVDGRRVSRLRAALSAFARQSAVTHRALRVDLVTLVPADSGRWRIERLPGIDAW